MMNSCTFQDQCQNCPGRCDSCLAFWEGVENVLQMELPLLYVPHRGSPKVHPLTERRKAAKRQRQRAEGERRRSAPVKKRRQQTANALRNEAQTRTVFARATRRSGAAFGDGDSRLVKVSGEELPVGIDDKFHSKATKTVSLSTDEIDKARRQNCIVVVTLANGRKFAVAEFDYFTYAADQIGQLTTQEDP